MSRCWGWLAERPVPETFRPTVFGAYSSAFGVNIEEALISDFKYVKKIFFSVSKSLSMEFCCENCIEIYSLFRFAHGEVVRKPFLTLKNHNNSLLFAFI
jgi:hypothetical protein